MTASVTHHKVVITPDDGTSEVGSDEWNEGHDISIAPADIGASADDHDHDAAYDVIGAAAGAESAAEGYADSAVATHTGDSSAAHAASAVAVTPVGAVAATDVQAAIQELDSEKSATGHDHSGTYDPAGTASSAVSTHAGLADPHTGYLQESVIGGITDSTSTTSSTTAASATAAKAAFDVGNGKPSLSANAAVTQAFGDSAANGSGTAAAKDDHKHGMPAAPPTVATDALWDAAGDLAVGSGANTSAKLTAGSDDYILMADASVTGVGLKWAAPGATPSTQASGDAAAAGTTDGYERAGHKHAMPDLYISVPFSRQGVVLVTTETTALAWYNDTGRTLTFASVRATVKTAPTGASLIVDVNMDGTTIYTTGPGTNRPTIAISGTTGTGGTPDVTTVANGHYVSVNVDQIGSTVAGSDLSVVVLLKG